MDMKNTIQFTIENDLAEIERLSAKIEAFAAPLGIPEKIVFQINLALDEIITNIIEYGYQDAQNPPITLNMDVYENKIKIEIIDYGRPFNPADAHTPVLDGPIEARPTTSCPCQAPVLSAVEGRRPH